ncbi:hypothetical protein [Microbacterium atlanticum]|uniref:hypothetical protein n=1 Tax=Microbacterium atlanticum TaxID=2782168 RepID=UPI001889499D|nr:hypothetical protein [Microbacterium atlanticum]
MPLITITYSPDTVSLDDLRDALTPIARVTADHLGLLPTDLGVEVRPPSELTLHQRSVSIVFDSSPDPAGERAALLPGLADLLVRTVADHLVSRGLTPDVGAFVRIFAAGSYAANIATSSPVAP